MQQRRPVHQRYQREFWPPMLAYVLIMFLLWPLLPRVHDEALKIGLALLPVLPILLVVRAMVRLVLGSDELEQRVHLIGLAIAATVVSALSMVGGFLSAAGVLHFSGSVLLWVWPTLVIAYGVARVWASRRYGVGDVMCNDGVAKHWRLLLGALTLAVAALLGRHLLSDNQLGMLCGISFGLALGAVMLVIKRWRRRELGRRAAS